MHNAIYESANNIVDHADLGPHRSGYTVAQSYRLGAKDRRYIIAIADSGRGVAASLRENHEVSVPDDLRALSLACEQGITGALGKKNEMGGPRNVGQGLFELDKIAESTGGTFALCSGSARRIRTGHKLDSSQTIWSWQGTIVLVTLTYNGVRRYVESIKSGGSGTVQLG